MSQPKAFIPQALPWNPVLVMYFSIFYLTPCHLTAPFLLEKSFVSSSRSPVNKLFIFYDEIGVYDMS